MMHISHAAHGYFSQPASAAPQLAFSAAWHGVGGGGGGGAAKAPAAIAAAKIIVATIAAAVRNVVFSSGYVPLLPTARRALALVILHQSSPIAPVEPTKIGENVATDEAPADASV
jgi:hypothetical protein